MKDKIAIVGGGIFGITSALELDKAGYEVTVIESSSNILNGASSNNQNRLHLGFHYPRDLNTARQSIKGFYEFRNAFEECVIDDFDNAYFISNHESKVSFDEYLSFCDSTGVEYKQISNNNFDLEMRNTSGGVLCSEAIYDFNLLRKTLLDRVKLTSIRLLLNSHVSDISKDNGIFNLKVGDKHVGFDCVINSTYANINTITSKLGYKVNKNQYEYTIIPVIKWDKRRIGATIMDGEFTTLLPYGNTGNFLLYHVKNSVIESYDGDLLKQLWLDKKHSPFSKYNREKSYDEFIYTASKWIPEITGAKIIDFLHGPRMVLSNKHNTDERPTIINNYGDGYITIFSGKVDHCLWVARDVLKDVKLTFNQ